MRLARPALLLAVAGVLLPVVSAAAAVPGASSAAPRKVTTVSDPRITENSGLAVSPTHADLVWTVNDSGSGPVVYGVSTRTGRTRAALRMADVDARDMEALAAGRDGAGRSWLWIGDIGDNRTVRESVVLRLFREPAQVRSQDVAVTSLRVRYQHGPADAETLVWLPDGRLLIVTKAFLSSRVYQVPAVAVRRALAGHDVTEPVVAQQVGTIPQTLATDGSALPDGRFVVRGYESATIWSWVDGTLVADAPVTLPDQPQGEGIGVERSGRTALVSSEGEREPLYRVTLPAAGASDPTSSTSPTSPTASPGASNGTGAPRDEPMGAGAPSDDSGTQWGAPAAFVGGIAAGLLVVLTLAVRGARRRSRRTR
ncbi:hypothetical protein [Angustibacter luteus]|uniref:WD40 repeat domain-containing protein n=1 Tax=Angustibacter luteus TaxID=658456 RepID=A0ABW1JBE8_9ACTN